MPRVVPALDPGYTTRAAAARACGVTERTIVAWEKKGRIHPTRTQEGFVRLRVEEVEEARRKHKAEQGKPRSGPKVADAAMSEYRGRMAAACFPLFAAGASLADTVVQSGCDPAVVRDLYDEWLLGFEDGRREKDRRRLEYQENVRKRAHEQKMASEDYRKWKLELARTLAVGLSARAVRPHPRGAAAAAREATSAEGMLEELHDGEVALARKGLEDVDVSGKEAAT